MTFKMTITTFFDNLQAACRRNLVLTDLLAFAIDFWMLPRYIPEHFGIFSEV